MITLDNEVITAYVTYQYITFSVAFVVSAGIRQIFFTGLQFFQETLLRSTALHFVLVIEVEVLPIIMGFSPNEPQEVKSSQAMFH